MKIETLRQDFNCVKDKLIALATELSTLEICNPTSQHYSAIIHGHVEYILSAGEFSEKGFFAQFTAPKSCWWRCPANYGTHERNNPTNPGRGKR